MRSLGNGGPVSTAVVAWRGILRHQCTSDVFGTCGMLIAVHHILGVAVWDDGRRSTRNEALRQFIRYLIRFACGLLLLAPLGVVGWMANAIRLGNADVFLNWNSLYDYISIGVVVFSFFLLAAIAAKPRKGTRLVIGVLGLSLLAVGAVGHYGFKYLSMATLAPIPPMKQLKPNAAETVLGYHYACPTLGGQVAFGDGSVKYVDPERFATLSHADTPDQPPEFISPVKEPPADKLRENGDERQGESVISRAQERINHGNNLKRMAMDHFRFRARSGIRVPLKPEHFVTYFGMPDDLRKGISDGTYIWYFGWQPTVSYAAEKARALWCDFVSWASIYVAGFGAGLLLAASILVMKRPQPAQVASVDTA